MTDRTDLRPPLVLSTRDAAGPPSRVLFEHTYVTSNAPGTGPDRYVDGVGVWTRAPGDTIDQLDPGLTEGDFDDFVYLSVEDARELFNWLGVFLHTARNEP